MAMEHFTKVCSGLYIYNGNNNYMVKKVPNVRKYEIIENGEVIYTRTTLNSALVNCRIDGMLEAIRHWGEKMLNN